MKRIFIVFTILWMSIAIAPAQEDHWMPDSNLRAVIIEQLGLPEGIDLTQKHVSWLKKLDVASRNITNLKGLEPAIHLEILIADNNQIKVIQPLSNLVNLRDLTILRNQISDISPLANLINLESLTLGRNQISDITPLLNLIELQKLGLNVNQISDITPLRNLTQLWKLDLGVNKVRDITVLKNLTNLRDVRLYNNPVEDISPLLELPLLETLLIRGILADDITPLFALDLVNFEYNVLCEFVDIPVLSAEERVLTRTYPSIFQSGQGLAKEGQPNDDELFTLHDLHIGDFTPYNASGARIRGRITVSAPIEGLTTQLTGDIELAKTIRQRRLALNPNYLFLVSMGWSFSSPGAFPEDSDFWARDADGNRVRIGNIVDDLYIWNYLNPEVQDLIVERAVSFSECGLFDGILLDGFVGNGIGYNRQGFPGSTDAELLAAVTGILRRIRERVREDFLIIVNANRTKPTAYTEYVNGTVMEVSASYARIYTYRGLKELESTLSWAEENLRFPQINTLRGGGIATEPPDSPENVRQMRLITTLSLTHSDGYVLYTKGKIHPGTPGNLHIWHEFWNADLGRPIGKKAQLYENREGLFIREFTNGWAVYNRSGRAQEISLPIQTTGVASGNTSFQHTVPDLDGEMFLKTDVSADVNDDGEVNILDLVVVANAFGEAEPDLNGDGVVNIQDLVIVANAF